MWDVYGIPDLGEKDSDGPSDRGIRWRDYEPGVAIVICQLKTGKRLRIPLADAAGEGEHITRCLELEAELGRSFVGAPGDLIVREEPSGLLYKHRRMSSVHREICDAAGLPKKPDVHRLPPWRRYGDRRRRRDRHPCNLRACATEHDSDLQQG